MKGMKLAVGVISSVVVLLLLEGSEAEAPVANYMSNYFDPEPTLAAPSHHSYGWSHHPAPYYSTLSHHSHYAQHKVDKGYTPYHKKGKKHYKGYSRPEEEEEEEELEEEPEEEGGHYHHKKTYKKGYGKKYSKSYRHKYPKHEEEEEPEEEEEEESSSGGGKKKGYHHKKKHHHHKGYKKHHHHHYPYHHHEEGHGYKSVRDMEGGDAYNPHAGWLSHGWHNTMLGGYDDFGYNLDSSASNKGQAEVRYKGPSHYSAPSLSEHSPTNSYSFASGNLPTSPTYASYDIKSTQKPTNGYGNNPYMTFGPTITYENKNKTPVKSFFSSLFSPSSGPLTKYSTISGGSSSGSKDVEQPEQKQQEQASTDDAGQYLEDSYDDNYQDDKQIEEQEDKKPRDIFRDDEDELKSGYQENPLFSKGERPGRPQQKLKGRRPQNHQSQRRPQKQDHNKNKRFPVENKRPRPHNYNRDRPQRRRFFSLRNLLSSNKHS